MKTEEIEKVLLSIYDTETTTKVLVVIEEMVECSSETVWSVGLDCLQNHLDGILGKMDKEEYGFSEGLGYLTVTKNSEIMWVGWLKRKLRDFLNHKVKLTPPTPELGQLHSIIAVEWINDDEYKANWCGIKIILLT